MKTAISIVTFLLLNYTLYAQNLVPNSGFEHHYKFPCNSAINKEDFAGSIRAWRTPTIGTPDLYSTQGDSLCQNYGLGYILAQQSPHSGAMMAGLFTSPIPEYMEVELKKPLVKGRYYYVEFWVALKKGSIPTEMGVYFSENFVSNYERVLGFDPVELTYKPQINGTNLLTQKGQWRKVAGVFQATSAAKFMTIGRFFDKDKKAAPDAAPAKVSYVFVDDVLVIPVETNQIPAEKDIYKAVLVAGETFELDLISFTTGKADLLPSSYPELNKLVDMMKANPLVQIEIGGHTDNKGSAESNMKLSEARAQSVKNYLISKGVPETRIIAKGYGSSRPVDDNTIESGRERNRRVEVKILKK